MSDVEVVDEPLPRRRQAARRAKPIQVVVEDSDSEAYQPSPLRSKKRKHNAQAEELDATEVAEASSKCRKKAAKQPGQKRTDAFGRTVRFAASPSQAVLQRIQRALPGSAHRMFLISTKELSPAGAGAGRSQEFAVLGATGNVYTVTTSRHPHCTCPDHAKGNLCKHILFVMLRVLKLATDNPLVWQKALLTNEVEEVLSGAHSQGTEHLLGVLADERVRRAYSAATGGGDAAADVAKTTGPEGRRSVEGGCPICFDELEENAEPLVWCTQCGNNMHKKCFNVWANTKRRTGGTITCVYCRAPWANEAGAGASPVTQGYVNLAQYSSVHAGGSSLEQLYGENAVWINGRVQGRSRGAIAHMYRADS